MEKFCFIIVVIVMMSSLWADVINVPEDYATIQAAIDAAVDGDEIIVSPGIYYENINFGGKAVTLGSHFYTTQDTSYISQTIIDGGENGSVVTFENEESAGSVLTGFTITNGYTENYGGGIFTSDYCSPTLNNLRIINNHAEWRGGGYYFGEYCNSELRNLLVADNTAQYGAGGAYGYYCDQIMEDSVIRGNVSDGHGGGIYCDETDISFNDVLFDDNVATYGGALCQMSGSLSMINVNIHGNQAETGGGIVTYGELYLESVEITENSALNSGGGIHCSYIPLNFCEEPGGLCSIYLNECESGIGSDLYAYDDAQNIILNTFSVQCPTDYYATPVDNFTFDIISGVIPQIDGDVYVSAYGSNDNSGLSADQPLQTIRQACALIAVTDEYPHTIYLDAGTYSASETGESFPVKLLNNVSLRGVNRESVILDAEGNSGVMVFSHKNNITVRGLTIYNGNTSSGGGISCYSSYAEFTDLIIRGNHASNDGGGMYLSYQSSILSDLLVYGNTAGSQGGGIYSKWNGFSILQNVTAWGNSAVVEGGGLCTNRSQPKIINSIFSNNEPNEINCNGFGSEISLAYCDIDGGTNEIYAYSGQPNILDGVIYEVPQFVGAENGDFRLADDSPCIDMGTANFEYEGEVWIDMPDDEYWGEAPDMGAYEYSAVYYGDIDDNSIVESYDASLVLMNVVGINALEEDQLPWEEWRQLRADIDLDAVIGAVDGAYILQYVVGIIDEFPVYNNNRAMQNLLTLTDDDKYFYLSSTEEIIGLSFNVLGSSNVKLSKAEVLAENCLYYQNGSQFALASAEGVSGRLLRLSYNIEDSNYGSVQIELSSNGYREVIDYYIDKDVPVGTDLSAIYPNPFNPETTIEYQIAEDGKVKLEVFNVKGQKVLMLINNQQKAGNHSFTWNADDMNSGIYFIRLTSVGFQKTSKAVLLK